MKRDKVLLERRSEFVMNYLKENSAKRINVIIKELSDILFLTERTIYTIMEQSTGPKRDKKE